MLRSLYQPYDGRIRVDLKPAKFTAALNASVAQPRIRWSRLRPFVEGTPTLRILHGEVIPAHVQP